LESEEDFVIDRLDHNLRGVERARGMNGEDVCTNQDLREESFECSCYEPCLDVFPKSVDQLEFTSSRCSIKLVRRFLALAYMRLVPTRDIDSVEYGIVRDKFKAIWRSIVVYYVKGLQAFLCSLDYDKSIDGVLKYLHSRSCIDFYIDSGVFCRMGSRIPLAIDCREFFKMEFTTYDHTSYMLVRYVAREDYPVCRLVNKTMYTYLRAYSSVVDFSFDGRSLWLTDLVDQESHPYFALNPEALEDVRVTSHRNSIVRFFPEFNVIFRRRQFKLCQRDMLELFVFLVTQDPKRVSKLFRAVRDRFLKHNAYITVGLLSMEMRIHGMSWPYGSTMEYMIPMELMYSLNQSCGVQRVVK